MCLSVLMDIPGNTYIDLKKSNQGSRFVALDAEVQDRNHGVAAEGTPLIATLQLGQLQSKLTLRASVSDAESMLPVAYIKERTRDGRLILDDNFLPPMLDFRAIGWIDNAVTELLGLIVQRLESVYRPDVTLSVGGLSELLELLLLQTLSEYNLKISHVLMQNRYTLSSCSNYCLGCWGVSVLSLAEKNRGRGRICSIRIMNRTTGISRCLPPYGAHSHW